MEKFKFFSHKECDFFPCHDVSDPDEFNCLFCYCPLFALGDRCGGNFRYTEGGIKDCSSCMLPHSPKAYDYIVSKFDEIMEIAKVNHNDNGENA